MSDTSELPPGGPAPHIEAHGGRSGVDDRNSDLFFAAVETTRMPMTVTDPHQPDNPIIFANNAFIQMTGYSREELIGRNCRFLQGPETDRKQVEEVRHAVEARAEFATEILNYRKNGSTFWNALFISPVYATNGELLYFFGSQLDVSRRRDAEDALRQSQKMEALGQLTGGIAHDFNNLLQVIVGYMDSLTHQAERTGDARMVRQLDAVADAAQRATKLTQQLLAFSRKQRLEGRAMSLNALVENMADIAERTLGAAIHFRRELADDLWNAKLDPVQSELALLNIVINARDAMPDGGSVTIRTANRVFEEASDDVPRTLSPGRYVEVAITDTGTGIPPEVLGRVMDPFFTTKEEGKGTGLGLSSVYGFARQSGGRGGDRERGGRRHHGAAVVPRDRPGGCARRGQRPRHGPGRGRDDPGGRRPAGAGRARPLHPGGRGLHRAHRPQWPFRAGAAGAGGGRLHVVQRPDHARRHERDRAGAGSAAAAAQAARAPDHRLRRVLAGAGRRGRRRIRADRQALSPRRSRPPCAPRAGRPDRSGLSSHATSVAPLRRARA